MSGRPVPADAERCCARLRGYPDTGEHQWRDSVGRSGRRCKNRATLKTHDGSAVCYRHLEVVNRREKGAWAWQAAERVREEKVARTELLRKRLGFALRYYGTTKRTTVGGRVDRIEDAVFVSLADVEAVADALDALRAQS